jgi:hypothetical protein
VTLYAAYGTNLDPPGWASAARTPPAHDRLAEGWRLTFGGEEHGWDGALSTIVQDPIEQVFVAVYDVTREDERPSTAGSRPTPASTARPRSGSPR